MKIAVVLISAFLLISLIIGFTSVVGIRLTSDNVSEIAEREIPKVRNALQMQIYANEAAKHVIDYVRLNDAKAKTDFHQNVQAFKALSNVYNDLSETPQERQLYNRLISSFTNFEQSGNDMIAVADAQREKFEDMNNLYNDKIKATFDDLLKDLSPSELGLAKKQTALQQMQISMYEIISSSSTYVIRPDALVKDRMNESADDFQKWQDQFSSTQLTKQEIVDFNQLKKHFASVKILSQEIIALEDRKLELLVQFEEYEKQMDNLLDDEVQPIAISKINEVEDNALNTTNTTVMAFIGSAILATSLGLVISRSISKPIAKIRDAANEIAKGNLDVQLKVSGNGEISSLSKSFNTMVDRIKTQDKAQKEFISVASHEIRSPIQPILSYADLAKKGHISQDEAWTAVLTQARRLQHLSNDILYVTRIEGGDLTYIIKRVKINAVILEVVDAAKVNLRENVLMETKLDKEIEIEGDKDRITQVLTNVIGNAVKFTKQGHIRVETHVLAAKNRIEISVSDTAGGIPNDILPKLFGKFVTKPVGSEVQHGTGLGLFISKAIVTAHKGEISAYDNDEGGATFTITLPIRQ